MEENKLPVPYEPEYKAVVPYGRSRAAGTSQPVVTREAEVTPWPAVMLRVLCFFFICVAFAALFYSADEFFHPQKSAAEGSGNSGNEADGADAVPAGLSVCETEADAALPGTIGRITVSDESGIGIDTEKFGSYFFGGAAATDAGTFRVLITASHPGELCSGNITAVEAGQRLAEILTEYGTGAVFLEITGDGGKIGAYDIMRDAVAEYAAADPGIVLVADIHDSALRTPLTLTVGSAVEGWNENLTAAGSLALAAAERGDENGAVTDVSLRIVPAVIGQNGGCVSLHIGMGGSGYPDADTEKVIDLTARCIAGMFAAAPSGTH